MCNEAKSLPAWPRKLARWTMLAAAVTFAVAVAAASAAGQRNARGDDDIRAASDSEPVAPKVSLDKAAGLLDAVALDWTNRRQCGTRHTN